MHIVFLKNPPPKCFARLREEAIFSASSQQAWTKVDGQQKGIFDFSEFQMLFLKIVCRFAKDATVVLSKEAL